MKEQEQLEELINKYKKNSNLSREDRDVCKKKISSLIRDNDSRISGLNYCLYLPSEAGISEIVTYYVENDKSQKDDLVNDIMNKSKFFDKDSKMKSRNIPRIFCLIEQLLSKNVTDNNVSNLLVRLCSYIYNQEGKISKDKLVYIQRYLINTQSQKLKDLKFDISHEIIDKISTLFIKATFYIKDKNANIEITTKQKKDVLEFVYMLGGDINSICEEYVVVDDFIRTELSEKNTDIKSEHKINEEIKNKSDGKLEEKQRLEIKKDTYDKSSKEEKHSEINSDNLELNTTTEFDVKLSNIKIKNIVNDLLYIDTILSENNTKINLITKELLNKNKELETLNQEMKEIKIKLEKEKLDRNNIFNKLIEVNKIKSQIEEELTSSKSEISNLKKQIDEYSSKLKYAENQSKELAKINNSESNQEFNAFKNKLSSGLKMLYSDFLETIENIEEKDDKALFLEDQITEIFKLVSNLGVNIK